MHNLMVCAFVCIQDISNVILSGQVTHKCALREEHLLKVFKNGVLSKIFRPKSEEVTEA